MKKSFLILLFIVPIIAIAQEVTYNNKVYKIGDNITLSSRGASENGKFMFIRKSGSKIENAFKPIESTIEYISTSFAGKQLSIKEINKTSYGTVLTVSNDKEYFIWLEQAIKYCEITECDQSKILKYGEVNLPIDTTNGVVTYAEIIKLENAPKNELYLRGKEWFARTFVSANDVIQLDDRETGKIIGKGFTKSSYKGAMGVVVLVDISYTISLVVKENRYRYEITSLSATHLAGNKITANECLDWINSKKAGKSMVLRLMQSFDDVANGLSFSLKKAMVNAAKSKDEF